MSTVMDTKGIPPGMLVRLAGPQAPEPAPEIKSRESLYLRKVGGTAETKATPQK